MIQNIHQSIMGTIEFELKASGQRGFQEFIFYPKNDESPIYQIQ